MLCCVGHLCVLPEGPCVLTLGVSAGLQAHWLLIPISPSLPTQEALFRLLLSLLLRRPALAPVRRISATCSWWSSNEAPQGWGWA